MGLLDRWTKKRKENQLKAVEEKSASVKDVKKPVEDNSLEPKKRKVKSKPKKKVTKTGSEIKTKKTSKGEAYKVLVRPVVSEKAATAEARGVYTFVVSRNADKPSIKRAIKQIYGVTPKKVRVMNMEGKRVRFGREFGRRSDWKKAIVTLVKGQTINIHEGV